MKEILEYKLFEIAGYSLSVYTLVQIAVVYLATRFLISLSNRFLKRMMARKGMDAGRQQSFWMLFNYIIWIGAVALMLHLAGFQLTFLLVSSSALLVGLGLGLQQIFSDIVSGIFLLFDGTVEVGDILEVGGMVGRVEEIGLRTSKFRNRDDMIMIIPNHKFIHENVVNWSHNTNYQRFIIPVGVSYKSDIHKVKRVLYECARKNKDVLTTDSARNAEVRLTGFGDSSVNFDLLFYSSNMFSIEQTKSEIRFAIWDAFRENDIEIPYPQVDMHIRNLQN